MTFREDAWLAGFIAGEGCFTIHHSPVRGVSYYTPTLRIGLRDDDAEVLHELQAEMGGRLFAKATNRGHPAVDWTISSKVDLLRACEYIDRFPLRAKKGREYPIWRAAVHTYVEDGGRAPLLVVAKQELEAVRAYQRTVALVD